MLGYNKQIHFLLFLEEGKVSPERGSVDEDGEYETIAGFVTTKMEKIPRPGDSFEFAGVSYLVLKASERKIERLRIEIITNHEKVNN